MRVKIYQPAKSAMQSGRAGTSKWLLKHKPVRARKIDSLTGFYGAGDPERQLKLTFDSRDEAIAYAEAKGYDYEVSEPKARKVPIKSYSDNFKALQA